MAIPRDRNGNFEPILVPKGESRLVGFDEKILSLYARGMSTWEIQAQIQELWRTNSRGGGTDPGRVLGKMG